MDDGGSDMDEYSTFSGSMECSFGGNGAGLDGQYEVGTLPLLWSTSYMCAFPVVVSK